MMIAIASSPNSLGDGLGSSTEESCGYVKESAKDTVAPTKARLRIERSLHAVQGIKRFAAA